MRKTLLAAALSLPMLASAQNLLTNGSFENGLTGWTASTGATYNPIVITYGAGAASGEAVPADGAASPSPDPVGTKAVYLVDDTSTLTLSQTFTVTAAGQYTVGFDTYVPANGYSNPFNATFSATVDSTTFVSTNVGALPSTTWQAQAGTFSLGVGTHTVTFSFTPTGVTSKDLIIDRAYVLAAIPEPETYALMLAGLAAIGFVARRRNRA